MEFSRQVHPVFTITQTKSNSFFDCPRPLFAFPLSLYVRMVILPPPRNSPKADFVCFFPPSLFEEVPSCSLFSLHFYFHQTPKQAETPLSRFYNIPFKNKFSFCFKWMSSPILAFRNDEEAPFDEFVSPCISFSFFFGPLPYYYAHPYSAV